MGRRRAAPIDNDDRPTAAGAEESAGSCRRLLVASTHLLLLAAVVTNSRLAFWSVGGAVTQRSTQRGRLNLTDDNDDVEHAAFLLQRDERTPLLATTPAFDLCRNCLADVATSTAAVLERNVNFSQVRTKVHFSPTHRRVVCAAFYTSVRKLFCWSVPLEA